jgi:hypothetical protein
MPGAVGKLQLLHFHSVAHGLDVLQQHCGLVQSALSLHFHLHCNITYSLWKLILMVLWLQASSPCGSRRGIMPSTSSLMSHLLTSPSSQQRAMLNPQPLPHYQKLQAAGHRVRTCLAASMACMLVHWLCCGSFAEQACNQNMCRSPIMLCFLLAVVAVLFDVHAKQWHDKVTQCNRDLPGCFWSAFAVYKQVVVG